MLQRIYTSGAGIHTARQSQQNCRRRLELLNVDHASPLRSAALEERGQSRAFSAHSHLQWRSREERSEALHSRHPPTFPPPIAGRRPDLYRGLPQRERQEEQRNGIPKTYSDIQYRPPKQERGNDVSKREILESDLKARQREETRDKIKRSLVCLCSLRYYHQASADTLLICNLC